MLNIGKRIMAAVLCIVMLYSLSLGHVDAASAGNVTVNGSGITPDIGTYGVGVGNFTVKSFDGKTYKAYCACHEKKGVTVGMTLSARVTTNESIRKCLYYGNGGPKDQGYGHTPTSLAISVANGHLDSSDTGESSVSIGRNTLTKINALPSPPASFLAYYASSPDTSFQDVVFWVYSKGSAKLKKTSVCPELTDGNACYSLKNASYEVYSDSACTTKVGTFTTDDSGESNTMELDVGTYYVRETNAPKGYAADAKTHTITVKGDETTTLNVTDVPQKNPMSMLLGKYDGEKSYMEEGNLPQGSATLEGAEFTCKFYGGYYDTVQELENETPLRTWIFRTDEKGLIYYSDEYFVGGDALWSDQNGNFVLPLGTVTMQETKAPKGYLINDEIILRKIMADGSGEEVHTYKVQAVSEEVIRGDLEIIKVYQPDDPKQDVLEPIEGVEFTITSDTTGEEVMKIVTDKDGKATTKSDRSPRGGLIYDTYTITETKYPEGYTPVRPFQVAIHQEQVTLTGIYRQDTLLSSPIQVVKVDAGTGKVIPFAGTTFQLLDAQKNVMKMTAYYPSKKELTEFVSDENGQILFPEMLKCGTYYLREIKAPEGYVLNSEEVEFTITDGADWENPVVVKVENQNAMGKVRVLKMDEETGEALEGISFAVIAQEDIVTADGTLRAAKDEVVDEIVTDQDGVAVSGELFLGKYRLREQNTPDGYINSGEDVPFELEYKDQTTAVITLEVCVKNKPNQFRIVKCKKGTNQLMQGVKFAVWRQNDHQGEDETAEEQNAPDIYETNENGEIKLRYLTAGTYIASETETNEGFLLSGETFEFTVDANGLINGKEEEVWNVENDYTKVKISKKDATTGKEVPGASLQITNEDGEIIEEWVTSDEPYLIEELPVGEYCLKETCAPKGYEIASDVKFTVEETGEIQNVEMKEERVKQKVTSVRTGDDEKWMVKLFLLIISGSIMFIIHRKRTR